MELKKCATRGSNRAGKEMGTFRCSHSTLSLTRSQYLVGPPAASTTALSLRCIDWVTAGRDSASRPTSCKASRTPSLRLCAKLNWRSRNTRFIRLHTCSIGFRMRPKGGWKTTRPLELRLGPANSPHAGNYDPNLSRSGHVNARDEMLIFIEADAICL